MKMTHRVLSLIMVAAMLFSSCAFAVELPEIKVYNHEEHVHEHVEVIETEEAAVEAEAVEAAPATEAAVEELDEMDLFDPSVYGDEFIPMPEVKAEGETEETTETFTAAETGIDCSSCGDAVVIDYWSASYSSHRPVCIHGCYGSYFDHVNDDGVYTAGSYYHYWNCDICNYQESGTHYTNCDVEDKETCLACGYTSSYISIEIKHDKADTRTTDEVGHWYDCSRCDEQVEYAVHYARCLDVAEDGTGTCVTCKAEGVTIGSVGHDWEGYYATEEGHYYFCETCQQPYGDLMKHYAYCDNKTVCHICDYDTGAVIEGYDHTGSYTFTYDEEGHYNLCDTCNEVRYSKTPHSADCTTPTECRNCDYVAAEGYIADLRHSGYDYETKVPYGEEGHGYKCTNENCPTGVCYGPYEHVGSCTDPSICRDCGWDSDTTEYAWKHGPINYDVYVTTEDGKGHGYLCETCKGAYYYQDYEDSEREPFDHRAEDCTKPNVCTACNYTVESDDIYIRISHGEVDYDTYVPTEDGKGHYYKCLTCEKPAFYSNESEPIEHQGSCLDPYTCKDCNYKTDYPMRAYHEWDYDNKQYDETGHWYICLTCNAVQDKSEHWAYCYDEDPTQCRSCEYKGESLRLEHRFYKDGQYQYTPGDDGHYMVCYECPAKSDWQENHFVDCTAEDKTVCSGCGGSGGYMYVEHDYDYDDRQHDEYEHWYVCNNCGEDVNRNEHYASCRYGETDVCESCDAEGVVVRISHDFWSEDGNNYQYDENGHWRTCTTCGVAEEKDRHWGNCKDPNTCYNCGYYSEKGFGEVDHNVSSNSRQNDEEYHWYVCADCGEDVYKYTHDAYCNDPYKCSECGYVSTEAFETYHRINWDAPVSTTATQHTFGCRYCDYQETSTHYVSCTANNNRCEECGYEVSAARVSHYWSNQYVPADDGEHCYEYCLRCNKIISWAEHYADCDDPSECARCGIALGANADTGHERGELIKSDEKYHYYKCKNCDTELKGYHYTRCNENKCETCGVSGSKYTLRKDHYNVIYTNNGKTHTGTCSDCGTTFDAEEHAGDCYEGGVCWSCGATENVKIYHVSGDSADECVYCQGSAPEVKPPVIDGATVTLNKTAATLGVGEKLTLTAEASHNGTVTFKSGKTSVATVNEKTGVVTPKAAGTAVITATASTGAKATCTITVKKAPTSIKVSVSKLTLGVNETATIGATLSSGSASAITFSTSNENVATVDANGKITAVSAGTAKVYAKTFNSKSSYCTVTVKAAPGVVTITPAKAELSVGQTTGLTTVLTTLDGKAAAGSYTYAAEPADAVTFEGDVLTAVKDGKVTITATTYDNLATGSVEINILPAPDKVTVEEVKDQTITLGVKETFTLKPSIENDSPADITYSTSKKSVATVSASGKITAKKTGTAIITVAPHAGEPLEITVNVVAAPKSVKLSSKTKTLGVGEEFTLKATLSSSKSASKLTWKSSKASVVSVDAEGNLTAHKTGKATITVTTFNKKKATCTVTVKAAPEVVTVTSSKTEMSVGQTANLTTKLTTLAGGSAVGAYTYSAEPADAVTFEKGVLTANKEGLVKVIATAYNGEPSEAVEINILPAPDKAQVDNLEELAITLGVKETFTLKVSAENGSPADFTFTSGKSSVASVGKTSGKITAKKTGTAVITATPHLGEPVDVTVTVVAAPKSVKLSAKKLTLGVGEEATLKATLVSSKSASKLTWKSSKASVVSVDAEGNLIANKAGTATITVSTFNKKKATCTVTVKPAPEVVTVTSTKEVMSVGQTANLTTKLTTLAGKTAAGAYTYSAEPADCVTIEKGVLTAVNPGTVTVTATTYKDLASGSVTIEVKEAPDAVADIADITLGVKETFTLKPTTVNGSPADYTFQSDKSSVASVSSSGKITAKKAGTAVITVKAHAGEPETVTVTVKRAPSSVKLSSKTLKMETGDSAMLTATLSAGSASNKLTWKSSKTSVVKVENGVLTAVGAGKATITVSTFNGKKATCAVTVTKPVVADLKAAVLYNSDEIHAYAREYMYLTAATKDIELEITKNDAEGSAEMQVAQAQNMIAQGITFLLVEAVDSTAAYEIDKLAQETNAKIVFFNTDPGTQVSRGSNSVYVTMAEGVEFSSNELGKAAAAVSMNRMISGSWFTGAGNEILEPIFTCGEDGWTVYVG